MTLLNNSDDWKWYKLSLDVLYKHDNDHRGEPKEYPCVVSTSDRIDEENSPYYFIHTFTYDEYIKCSACGHTNKIKAKQ